MEVILHVLVYWCMRWGTIWAYTIPFKGAAQIITAWWTVTVFVIRRPIRQLLGLHVENVDELDLWDTFFSAVKQRFHRDPDVTLEEDCLIFEADGHPSLPSQGATFRRFSSKISGRQGEAAERYIKIVVKLAEQKLQKMKEQMIATETVLKANLEQILNLNQDVSTSVT